MKSRSYSCIRLILELDHPHFLFISFQEQTETAFCCPLPLCLSLRDWGWFMEVMNPFHLQMQILPFIMTQYGYNDTMFDINGSASHKNHWVTVTVCLEWHFSVMYKQDTLRAVIIKKHLYLPLSRKQVNSSFLAWDKRRSFLIMTSLNVSRCPKELISNSRKLDWNQISKSCKFRNWLAPCLFSPVAAADGICGIGISVLSGWSVGWQLN